MALPLVSAIIPNYNYSQYLREAVDSALEQTYKNIEVIVVDDGSSDASREILQSYGDRIKTIFQENEGVSAARNNGVAASRGEFIAFLDADDVWLPQKIEKEIDRFKNDDGIGLVHVAIEEIDGEGNSLALRPAGQEGWVVEDLLLGHPVIYGGGSGFVVRRDVLDAVGGFDTELSTSADWDLFRRVAKSYRFGMVREVLIKYRIHNSNMHQNVGRMEREMLVGYEKAFNDPTSSIQRIRRRAYANLHMVLSGSYLHTRNYGKAVGHLLRSLWLSPANITYFLAFPSRMISRRGR